jgi:hypothetical protein
MDFIPSDYSNLSLPDEQLDLLISLCAGFISEHCTRFLRQGGHLLANPSHGDVAMAFIDPRYELFAVVQSRGGSYLVTDQAIDTYLVQKRETEVTAEMLHRDGRGVAYTKSPFAYIFRRTN